MSAQRQECSAVPVLEDGRLAGLLTLENLSERVRVNTALERRKDDRLVAPPGRLT